MYLRRRSPYGLWERWFATFVLLTFLYGVGGCAPWGPSLLRSQARFALPPAPTPAYVLAARLTRERLLLGCAHDHPLERQVPLAYRELLLTERNVLTGGCRYSPRIAAAQHVRWVGAGGSAKRACEGSSDGPQGAQPPTP